MRKPLLGSVLAAIVAAASLAAFATPPADPVVAADGPAIGSDAPAFSIPDSNGKTVSLGDYKGKVVVLEWINVDCPIDQRVINSKLISTVHDKFKDKVTWLAIDSAAAHTKADYDKTISQFKLSYPVLNDAKGSVGHMYNAKTTPHMYIISTEGKLLYKGGIDDDADGTKPAKVNYVDKALTELFAGKTISITESKPYGCSVKYAN